MIYSASYDNSFVEFDQAEPGATNLRVLDKVPVFGNIPINREYILFNTSAGELRQRFKIMEDIGYKGLDDTYLKLIIKEKRKSLYGEFGFGGIRPTQFFPKGISDLRYNASALYANVFATPPIADLFAIIICASGSIPTTLIGLLFWIAFATIILESLGGYGFFSSGRALQYMKYTRYEYTFKPIDGDPNGRIINRTKFLIDDAKQEVSKQKFVNNFYAQDFWKKYSSNNYASFASRHYGVSGPAFLSFPNSYNSHRYQELNTNLNKFFEDKKKIIEKIQVNIPNPKTKFLDDEKELIDKTTKTARASKNFFIDLELDDCVYERFGNRGNKMYIIDIGTFLDISATSKRTSGKAIPCGTGKPAILKSKMFLYYTWPRAVFVFGHASSLRSFSTGIEPEGGFTFDGSFIYPYSTWLSEFFLNYLPAIRVKGVIGGFVEIEKKYRRANIFADYPDDPAGHKFGILIGKTAPLYN
jgi:hypothetical protein